MAQYIDKGALTAELKKRVSDYWSDSENTMGIYPYALEEVIKYVDTLEVKEVDLEREIDGELKTRWMGEYLNTEKFYESAKHFFELGLKAQKGE